MLETPPPTHTHQEHYKWFAKDNSEFFELNTSSLAKLIAIARKVTRSARGKIKQDEQHRLIKFFLVKTKPKKV